MAPGPAYTYLRIQFANNIIYVKNYVWNCNNVLDFNITKNCMKDGNTNVMNYLLFLIFIHTYTRKVDLFTLKWTCNKHDKYFTCVFYFYMTTIQYDSLFWL
jgi:hypothetical protein